MNRDADGAISAWPGRRKNRVQVLQRETESPMQLQSLLYATLNTPIRALLRSPLHGIASRNLALLHYRGRKSGREFVTPLSYVREGASRSDQADGDRPAVGFEPPEAPFDGRFETPQGPLCVSVTLGGHLGASVRPARRRGAGILAPRAEGPSSAGAFRPAAHDPH